MTHPNPDQGHETPIDRLVPPEEQEQQQPRVADPSPLQYIGQGELEQFRLLAKRRLDEMTPEQRRRARRAWRMWWIPTLVIFVIAVVAFPGPFKAFWVLGLLMCLALYLLIKYERNRRKRGR